MKFLSSNAHIWTMCKGAAALADTLPDFSRHTSSADAGIKEHGQVETAVKFLIENRDISKLGYDADIISNAFELCQIIYGASEWGIEYKVKIKLGKLKTSGVIDFYARVENTLYIVDRKFQYGHPVSPRFNPQLAIYAEAMRQTLKMETPVLKMGIFQAGKLTFWEPDYATFQVFVSDILSAHSEAENFAKKAKANDIRVENADLKSGEHCRYCEAAAICPALSAYVKSACAMRETSLNAVNISQALDILEFVQFWVKSIKPTALALLQSGQHIPGYTLERGRAGNTQWTEPDENELIEILKRETSLSEDDIIDRRLKTPTQILNKLTLEESQKLEKYTYRPQGQLTVSKSDNYFADFDILE